MNENRANDWEALGRPVYPFTAIVGQDRLLLALLLNGINSTLSGLLVRGEKGTAKSTAVRALADLLPEIEVVKDCPFGCDPRNLDRMCLDCRNRVSSGSALPVERRKVRVVNLPLGSTEDRVVGTVDFEHALRTGEKRVEPGILAAANRNILYVDEINLLDDHIVDLLLDTLVTGMNIIEREGISFVHPSRFALVGTMNPEEGELRPQLLDRFGLCVAMEGIREIDSRVAVLKRREAFDADPVRFREQWAARQEAMRARIRKAKERLPRVWVPGKTRALISQVCLLNQVHGHRADIFLEKTAKTIAALEGRPVPSLDDLGRAAALVLPHRSRTGEVPRSTIVNLNRLLTEALARQALEQEAHGLEEEPSCPLETRAHQLYPDPNGPPLEADPGPGAQAVPQGEAPQGPEPAVMPGPEESDGSIFPGTPVRAHEKTEARLFGVGETFRVPPLIPRKDRRVRRNRGRRMVTRTLRRTGRYVAATSERRNNDLAFDATIRAAAPFQRTRPRRGLAIAIEEPDIREKVREMKAGCLMLFVVDASGSMGTHLMTETKAAMMSLLLDAYQRRDKVALVAFREDVAEVLLPPTDSPELARKLLEDLPAGGKTPLGHGLLKAYELLEGTLRRNPCLTPLMILVSDGDANVGVRDDRCYEGHGYSMLLEELFEIARMIRSDKRIKSLVIDTEKKASSVFYNPGQPNSMAQRIAEALGSSYCKIQDFRAGGLLRAVRHQVG